MIDRLGPFVVRRRESLCSRVNGGGVAAVGADARGRILPAEHIVHADADEPRDPGRAVDDGVEGVERGQEGFAFALRNGAASKEDVL